MSDIKGPMRSRSTSIFPRIAIARSVATRRRPISAKKPDTRHSRIWTCSGNRVFGLPAADCINVRSWPATDSDSDPFKAFRT